MTINSNKASRSGWKQKHTPSIQLAKYLVELGSILPKGPMYSFNAAAGGGLSVVAAAAIVVK
jgi:hypothetical protein